MKNLESPWQSEIWKAILAEEQAIAIYQAEVFFLRGKHRAVYRETLKEEESHLLGLESYLGTLGWGANFYRRLNRIGGLILGSVLSALPDLWRTRVHAWAEASAAAIYADCHRKLGDYWEKPEWRQAMVALWGNPGYFSLLKHLDGARRQEEEHSRKFAAFALGA